jgi:hypothetical protein
MAALTDDARVPLLASRDSDEFGEDLEVHFPLQTGKYRLRETGRDAPPQGPANNGGVRRTGSEASSSRKKKQQYSGSEMIVAVFVVAFDTKKGSWCWKYVEWLEIVTLCLLY